MPGMVWPDDHRKQLYFKMDSLFWLESDNNMAG